MNRTTIHGFAVHILLLLGSSAMAQEITATSLAGEIGNLRAVAFAPAVPFTARQFASYDRRSTDPAVATDEGWFANGDTGQFLRVETRNGKPEHVMAEADGPGAITRIWSADPKGILRVYLDGAKEPAIEEPFDKLLGGEHPLAKAPLAGIRSKGWNLHVPIPYAKKLVVTVSEPRLYYQVNVRTYPAGTTVKSWSVEEQKAAGPALAEAAGRLNEGLTSPGMTSEGEGFGGAIEPGEELTHAFAPPWPEGAMINVLVASLPASRDAARDWRHVVMRWTFDGEPCVETPLGDFFGCGPGLPRFKSLSCGFEGGAWSRWPMPFRKTCELTLRNLGPEAVEINVGATFERLPQGARLRHFHANWRQQLDFPTVPRQDWNALTATGGPGVYVGCALSILNPVPDWWGEGDEKMYVDGEKLPSTFGTGTEDFFGYAWCCPDKFQHALHGQPRCDGPGNKGFTALYRWQLLDCVPWTKSFKFDLEVWHWKPCTISQSMTVYWYADPGVRAAFPPLDAKALAIPVLKAPESKPAPGK